MPSVASDQKIWTALKRNPLTGIFGKVTLASERASERVQNTKGRSPTRKAERLSTR